MTRTMRWLLLFVGFLVFVVVVSQKSRSPFKTKKYKCVEVDEDDEPTVGKNEIDEEARFRKINGFQASLPRPPVEDLELPTAGRLAVRPLQAPAPPAQPPASSQEGQPTQIPPGIPANVPRDSQNRPLILSPQHCAQVRRYQSMYGLGNSDVVVWVENNCTMAKMFVPSATCEEIKILVASCYTKEELA